MPTPDAIHQLIARFRANLDSYKRGQYNETQVRREFIDPFFDSLGWDVSNRQGYAEAYKDVVHEDAIKVGGGVKAPDYGFRIGGVRKFFIEAKKPSVDVKGDPHPAYQLRRYAWSAKLPLSILTDFEEFAVYDCRVRPDKGDKPATARVLYLTFEQYAERWEEIAGIFSREAILKGAFDRFAEAKGGKRGTAEVDATFLAEIEGWRDSLARNIALRNPSLSQRELNFAVQRTIDRIIFLRICEDRGVEPYGSLLALVNGGEIYPRLLLRFRHADARYNSGLFHFEAEKGQGDAPDALTPRLAIDDKLLREILKSLYYPDSPYEFSVLPADLLGQVYEQFLGKVIRLTPGHRAVVEEKPEVRKAGGVFYTPTFIVDAIVQQTVGKLLAGLTLRQAAGLAARGGRKAAPLRVADIACGSGSFLLGAYQFLLDWYLAAYLADGAQKWATGRSPRLYQTSRGDWKLTVAERKRILLDHIYGVDIDPQAVEVTKLSLLLKVLEGEDEQTLGQQLALFPARALPDLGRNIQCGNSLIGPDFYEGQQLALLDDEAALRVNVFDWAAAFPQVFADGGFDVIIGNPPYIRIQALKEWAPVEVEYYKRRYRAASKGNYDIYVVFVEQGLALLNGQGRLGYILPHKFFNAQYGQPLRAVIAAGRHLAEVVHFGDQQVFAGATTYTCLLFLQKEAQSAFRFVKAHDLAAWRQGEAQTEGEIGAEQTSGSEWNFVIGSGSDLFGRLDGFPVKLGVVAHIFQGLVTGADGVFVMKADDAFDSNLLRPFLQPDRLAPYQTPTPKHKLLFPYRINEHGAELLAPDHLRGVYPEAWAHLLGQAKLLRERERGKWNHERWYAFGRSQNLTQMDAPKLIIQVTATRPTVVYDDQSLYMTGGGSGPFYGIRPTLAGLDMKFLMGILNSTLFGFYVKRQSTPLRGGYYKFSKQYIENAPIRTINFADPADAARHERMVGLVQRMLDLHKKLAAEGAPHVKTVLQRQIEVTDRQIDALVYELYGLTAAEIAVVEGG